MLTVLSLENVNLIMNKIDAAIPSNGVYVLIRNNVVRVATLSARAEFVHITQVDLRDACAAFEIKAEFAQPPIKSVTIFAGSDAIPENSDEIPENSDEILKRYRNYCKGRQIAYKNATRPSRVHVRDGQLPPSGCLLVLSKYFDALVLALMYKNGTIGPVSLGVSTSGLMLRCGNLLIPLNVAISHNRVRLATSVEYDGETIKVSVAMCVDRFTRYAQIGITPGDIRIRVSPVAIYPSTVPACLAGYSGVLL